MTQKIVQIEGKHAGREGAPYHPDPGLLAAVNTAVLLETPLLLAGEPGCGKTDFAWYAARALAAALGDKQSEKAEPLQCYVRSDTRARDLLYHYDALSRFADVQSKPEDAPKRANDPRHYIELKELGLALMGKRRRVVLIDEIDKAPRDLPNDLLRELDQGSFTIAEIPTTVTGARPDPHDKTILLVREMMRPTDGQRSLVIVTSNSERQLPDAFLRRCVYYYIQFPSTGELANILRERLPDITAQTLNDCLVVAETLRQPTMRLTKPPGTAEIIHWVRALHAFTGATVWKDIHQLSSVAKAIREGEGQKVHWRNLPGMHCLIKLKEDMHSLIQPNLRLA